MSEEIIHDCGHPLSEHGQAGCLHHEGRGYCSCLTPRDGIRFEIVRDELVVRAVELEAANDMVEQMKDAMIASHRATAAVTNQLADALREIERLREGLEKYAEKNNWGQYDADLSDGEWWLPDTNGWETAERYLNTPPSPASAPESAPTGAERQTDRPGETTGAGERLS